MTRSEADTAALLLERLLKDPALRARFRSEPAAVAREAGLEGLAGDLLEGSAMQTLEARESRSSLAGVMMAAAFEGVAGFGLVDQVSARARDLPPQVNRVLAKDPAGSGSAPASGGAPGLPGPADLATPEGAAASQASSQPAGEWSSRDAGSWADLQARQRSAQAAAAQAAQAAQAQPGQAGAAPAAQVAQPDQAAGAQNGQAAAQAAQVAQPKATARAASAAPDPSQYGATGTGGSPTPEALALLSNPRVRFLDSVSPKDLRSGHIDPRVVDVLTQLAKKDRITISAMVGNHNKLTSGGGVSNHYYGRAVDVAGVDGQAVSPGNAAAKKVAEGLIKLPQSIRPTEIGSPWSLSGPGYFTDGAHQNHIHIAFDNAISRSWQPPAGDAAPSSNAGVFPVVDPNSAATADPNSAAAADPNSAGVVDPNSAANGDLSAAALNDPNSDPSFSANPAPAGVQDPNAAGNGGGADSSASDSSGDSGNVREDGGSGDTEAEANQESDGAGDGSDSSGDGADGAGDGGDSTGDEADEGGGDVADSNDAADEATHDQDSGSSDSGSAPAASAAAPAPAAAVSPQAAMVDAAGGNAGAAITAYPGDGASRAQIAGWMASEARRNGLPPELPVMASLVESGMKNLKYGDADSVGYFQMRVGTWNNGPYAGYPQNPKLQVKWFIDKALEVKKQRVAQGQSVTDPNKYGEWIADVERPASQYRGRYQPRLPEARALLAQAASQGPPQPRGAQVQPGGAQVIDAAGAPAKASGGGGARAVQLAEQKVGTRESGNNAGGARQFQQAWGGSAGQPWCGYFVGTIARNAGAQGLTQRVASVPNIMTDAKAHTNGFVGWFTNAKQARPGDFVVEHGGGHVEMVVSANPDGSVNTVGGNTSGEGGGEGVFRKHRSASEIVGFARPKYPNSAAPAASASAAPSASASAAASASGSGSGSAEPSPQAVQAAWDAAVRYAAETQPGKLQFQAQPEVGNAQANAQVLPAVNPDDEA